MLCDEGVRMGSPLGHDARGLRFSGHTNTQRPSCRSSRSAPRLIRGRDRARVRVGGRGMGRGKNRANSDPNPNPGAAPRHRARRLDTPRHVDLGREPMWKPRPVQGPASQNRPIGRGSPRLQAALHLRGCIQTCAGSGAGGVDQSSGRQIGRNLWAAVSHMTTSRRNHHRG